MYTYWQTFNLFFASYFISKNKIFNKLKNKNTDTFCLISNCVLFLEVQTFLDKDCFSACTLLGKKIFPLEILVLLYILDIIRDQVSLDTAALILGISQISM